MIAALTTQDTIPERRSSLIVVTFFLSQMITSVKVTT
jgi:hypothetical protein